MALVITNTIEGTSRGSINEELDLESHNDQRWSQNLFYLHKIVNFLLRSHLPLYLNLCDESNYCARAAYRKEFEYFSTNIKIFELSRF